MQDNESKNVDVRYCYSPIKDPFIDREIICDIHRDPFAEFTSVAHPTSNETHEAPKPKQEDVARDVHLKKKQQEIERLGRLYCERKAEFIKANRIRWLLTFVGFAVAFLVILCLFAQPDIEDILNADITAILTILFIACMFSAFHIFVNGSIFGWLFQKIIAQDRRLDEIMKQIRELENGDLH